jgi:hypothetical protein
MDSDCLGARSVRLLCDGYLGGYHQRPSGCTGNRLLAVRAGRVPDRGSIRRVAHVTRHLGPCQPEAEVIARAGARVTVRDPSDREREGRSRSALDSSDRFGSAAKPSAIAREIVSGSRLDSLSGSRNELNGCLMGHEREPVTELPSRFQPEPVIPVRYSSSGPIIPVGNL